MEVDSITNEIMRKFVANKHDFVVLFEFKYFPKIYEWVKENHVKYGYSALQQTHWKKNYSPEEKVSFRFKKKDKPGYAIWK